MNVGAPAHEDNVSAVVITPRGVVAAVKPRSTYEFGTELLVAW